jgi:hypothetical protein
MHDVAKITVTTTDSQGMTVNTSDEEQLMQIKIWKFFDLLADDLVLEEPHLVRYVRARSDLKAGRRE